MDRTRITLSQIHVYPIKSARGVSFDESSVDERGLRHDRRWMLVDESGEFITQREIPEMALISPRPEREGLVVKAPGTSALSVPYLPESRERVRVVIWREAVEASAVSAEADRWFSDFLGFSCRLVYLPDDSARRVDPDYGRAGDQVGFADGFPFLLISEASLDNLNRRLDQPLPMNRFRPNLVVAGSGPFAEDGWRRFRIGSVAFRSVKPCARCKITTVDQKTAAVGKEPLRELDRFRKMDGKVLFGQNLIHDATGLLRVGDALEVIEGS